MSKSDFSGWTPARDEKVRTMLQRKASTREIAFALGVSQGAVARRIRKLGLKPAHVPNFKGNKNTATWNKPVVRKKVVVKVIKKKTVIQMVSTEKPAQPPAEVDDSVATIFAGEGIALAVVRDGLCRWPYDGGPIAQPRVCGETTTGAVYCAKHTGYATRGPKKWESHLVQPPANTRFI